MSAFQDAVNAAMSVMHDEVEQRLIRAIGRGHDHLTVPNLNGGSTVYCLHNTTTHPCTYSTAPITHYDD